MKSLVRLLRSRPRGAGRDREKQHSFRPRLEVLEQRYLLNGLAIPGALDVSQLKIDPKAYDPSSILVRFRAEDAGPGSPHALLDGTELGRPISLATGLREVRLGGGVSVAAALAAYRADPQVLYAEPNYLMRIATVPNDPFYANQWALNNIDAPEAWNVSQGNSDVVVAVIDTGIDYYHPDLAANIWTNPGEIAGNGADDDGNGYIDDVRGWDFVNGDNNPMDDNGHGTHVAGTIGANGNNGIGLAGVNWNVKIMALKFLDSTGSGTTSDAIDALSYAVQMGAKISNNSWGADPFSQALYNAIDNARTAGHIFVAAAGNDGANNDSSPFYPAGYELDNVIAVAATAAGDGIASFSNYGATSVDLAAPGVDIYSTGPANSYGANSGTSMAAPHVAGAAALVWAANPSLSAAEVKSLLLANTDSIATLNPTRPTLTNGRLNVDRAVRAAIVNLADPPPTVSLTRPADNATISGAMLVSAGASADTTRVEFFVDGTSIGVDSDGTNGWWLSWDATAVGEGRHRVSAAAFDFADQRTSDAVSVFVRNTLPSVPTGSSTYLGGSWGDQGDAVAVDAEGNTYVTGSTDSPDFPATAGTFHGRLDYPGPRDGFVAKLRADGTRAWAVFLGGSGEDLPRAIALDASGNLYVTGLTGSPDFPTTPGAYQQTLINNQWAAFVTKLDGASGDVISSTYFGAFVYNQQSAWGIAVDASGSAYLTGSSSSYDFPTTEGAFQRTRQGNVDAFVAKLHPDLSGLVYSTFLGADPYTESVGYGIAVDIEGNAYVTGQTYSSGFPTTSGALQTIGGGMTDAFLTVLNPAGSALVYSTYLGGGGFDGARGLARDASGNVYVSGYTESPDFPTSAGALSRQFSGRGDAFVAKLSPGFSRVYSTYLGGGGWDAGMGIAADASGNAYVLSGTGSSDFPATPRAFQPMIAGQIDLTVTKLDPLGSAPVYSTYLGGGAEESGEFFSSYLSWYRKGGIAVDGTGAAHVTADTRSADFPATPGAFQTSNNSYRDTPSREAAVAVLGPEGDLFPIAPQMRINNVFLPEGNSGTTPFVFTVSLSAPSTDTVTVSYATEDASAVAPGDYTAATGTLTFAPGETSQTITVLVNGDTVGENPYREGEFFLLNLTSAAQATLVDNQGRGTILDDEPQIRIGDVSRTEGNSRTTSFAFTVSLSAVSAQSITVSYATQAGSASAGKDYKSVKGKLTFAPGETQKLITVTVNGDRTAEPDETLYVNLSTTTQYATLYYSQGVGTILNDDGVAAASTRATGAVASTTRAVAGRASPLDRASLDWLFAAIAEDRSAASPRSKPRARGQAVEGWLDMVRVEPLLLDGELLGGRRR